MINDNWEQTLKYGSRGVYTYIPEPQFEISVEGKYSVVLFCSNRIKIFKILEDAAKFVENLNKRNKKVKHKRG